MIKQIRSAKPTAAASMRVLVMGNSGSGKTTLARQLAEEHGLVHLDLDSIVWMPGNSPVMRDLATVCDSVETFLARHQAWVIEGCYGDLIERLLPACSKLIFLNPGVAVCLTNNRKRSWEPHKYPSREQQDQMLADLQAWVESYYVRDDFWSLKFHRRLFDSFPGPKREVLHLEEA
jgi:adenylate kinase family enzyme